MSSPTSKQVNPPPLDMRVGGVQWGSKRHLDHLDAMTGYWAAKSREQDIEIERLRAALEHWLSYAIQHLHWTNEDWLVRQTEEALRGASETCSPQKDQP